MLAYYSGHRVGTADTFLSPYELQESRYQKKIIGAKNENARTLLRVPGWYRWHLTFTCARYQKINVLTKKRICLHTVKGTELSLLTPRFNLCDLQKWNYRRIIFRNEKRKYLHTFQIIALAPLTPLFYLWDLQKSSYQKKFIGAKNENARTLLRAPGWYLWHLTFTCARYQKINVLTEKRICLHTVQGTELSLLTPRFNLCDLQKLNYRRKIFWNEKRKCSHTVQIIALAPLTQPFHLCDLQKSRYRKKIIGAKNKNARTLLRAQGWYRWHLTYLCEISKNKCFDRKTNMLAYFSGYWVVTADTSINPVRPSEIELSKKNFLERKTKMLAYCSDHRVGTADTSLSPVRPPEIWISKKFIGAKNQKCTHTAQGTGFVPLTPHFYLCEISINKCLDRKTNMLAYFSGYRVVTAETSI